MTAPADILLKNGRVIDPVNGIDEKMDVLILAGRISSVRRTLKASASHKVIDCRGKWVVPGLIDMHVHLREPGDEHKETIASGTRAAAAGGFTAVACMPNTRPVNDCQAVTRLILEKAMNCPARVYPVGAISKACEGERLAELGEMKRAGVVAVSDDGQPVGSSQLMRRALEYSSNHGLPLISHAEELSLSHGGVMNEGFLSTKLGLQGIPRAAEEIMVYRDLALAEHTGMKVHIAHVSTGESVSLIRRAKAKGWPVTAETAPHYFSLTEQAVDNYDTNAKMNPPLRTATDVEAIIAGLQDGTIDAIATDHAPHSILEKEIEFDQAANGIIGLETAVPLSLRLARERDLTATRIIELLSVNPARILGVEGGSLTVATAADITVIDPARKFQLTREQLVSKSKNSPFLGWHLQGKAVLTMVDGNITYSDI